MNTYQKRLGLSNLEMKVVSLVFFGVVLALSFVNIYWVAGKFGIQLAPGWYQNIVDYVANGGTLVEAFAVVAGVTLPAWVGVVAAGFGLASA